MKISILLLENAKQIMITPETDHEKSALKMIAPGDKIEAMTTWGTFTDYDERTFGYNVDKCRGGYYRGYESQESLILLVEPKNKKNKND